MLGAASEILLLGTTVRLANNNSSATIQLNASAIAMATTATTVPITISTTGATSPVTISTTGVTSPVIISTAGVSNIVLSTIVASADASIELGTITFAATTTKVGKIQIAAGDILLLGSNALPGSVTLATNTSNRFIKLDTTNITIAHDAFTQITSKARLTNTAAISAGSSYLAQASAPLNSVLVKDNSTGEVKTLAMFPVMPIGGIIMWSGAVANIPKGWYLCDGQNVALPPGTFTTPDLRGKFIVGQNTSFPLLSTGGSSTRTLLEANLPSHAHDKGTLNITASGAHTHTVTINTRGYNFSGGGSPTMTNNSPNSTTSANTNSITHTHPSTDFSGITGPGAGTSTPFSILPPYYALAYIIYLGV